MTKRNAILSAIFLVGAIPTYGNVATSEEARRRAGIAKCRAEQVDICAEAISIPEFAGIAAAVTWPLYWPLKMSKDLQS